MARKPKNATVNAASVSTTDQPLHRKGRDKIKAVLLGTDPTRDYHASRTSFFGELYVQNLPVYRLWTGRMMMQSDPVVNFTLDIRDASMQPAEVIIEAKSPQIQLWLQDTWDYLWNEHRPKLLAAKKMGFYAMQPTFKLDKRGFVSVKGLKDFAWEDCRALEQAGRTVGFAVKGKRLYFPQALWTTFGAEFGSPYGTGTLRRMYPAWYEKWMEHGAKYLQKLRMIKDAYIGDIFWYPPNMAVTLPNGQKVTWRDLLREIAENRLSGGAMQLPRLLDNNGKELTGYTPPQDIAGGTQIFEWVDYCDKNIMAGAGVPLEAVEAPEVGSGYSGRSIPMLTLLGIVQKELVELVQGVDQHLLRPLAWLNFGGDPDYTIRPKSLVESFSDDVGGSPLGGPIGGAAQQPQQGMPIQIGQPPGVQFSEEEGSRRNYRAIVKANAAYYGIHPDHYHELAENIWAGRKEVHETREAAKAHAKKSLGTNARHVGNYEARTGSDSASFKKNLDTVGTELAHHYGHILGWHHTDHDLGDKVFELIKEPKKSLPSRTSDEYHTEVGKHLQLMGHLAPPKKRKRRSVEEMISFNPHEYDHQFSEDKLTLDNAHTLLTALGYKHDEKNSNEVRSSVLSGRATRRYNHHKEDNHVVFLDHYPNGHVDWQHYLPNTNPGSSPRKLHVEGSGDKGYSHFHDHFTKHVLGYNPHDLDQNELEAHAHESAHHYSERSDKLTHEKAHQILTGLGYEHTHSHSELGKHYYEDGLLNNKVTLSVLPKGKLEWEHYSRKPNRSGSALQPHAYGVSHGSKKLLKDAKALKGLKEFHSHFTTHTLGYNPHELDQNELEAHAHETFGGGSRFSERINGIQFADEPVEFNQQRKLHAPPGGVSIHGVKYAHGEHIPHHVINALDPAEKSKLVAGAIARHLKANPKLGEQHGTSGTPQAGTVPVGRGVPARSSKLAASSGQTTDQSHPPLIGLPTTVRIPGHGTIQAKPHPIAREVARKYMAEAGLPYNPPQHYAKVDPARATRIAAEYDKMKHDPQHPDVKAAYAAMAQETLAQYDAIMKHHPGMKINFIPHGQPDPYAASPRLATEDVHKNNHLWVFPTSAGFGTNETFDATHNPLLADSGRMISGQKATINDIFRAVHDYFGHIKEGVGFRHDGEENAWRSHSAMYSPLARRAMTSETRGQNSWLNFGPHGEKNRNAKTEDTVFADQKTGLMPEWVSTEGHHDHDIETQHEEGGPDDDDDPDVDDEDDWDDDGPDDDDDSSGGGRMFVECYQYTENDDRAIDALVSAAFDTYQFNEGDTHPEGFSWDQRFEQGTHNLPAGSGKQLYDYSKHFNSHHVGHPDNQQYKMSLSALHNRYMSGKERQVMDTVTNHAKSPAYTFAFANNTHWNTFGITGTGNAHKVIKNVTKHFRSILDHKDESTASGHAFPLVHFSSSEPSRSKLYDHLASRAASHHPYQAFKFKERPGGVDNYFMVHKDHAEHFAKALHDHQYVPEYEHFTKGDRKTHRIEQKPAAPAHTPAHTPVAHTPQHTPAPARQAHPPITDYIQPPAAARPHDLTLTPPRRSSHQTMLFSEQFKEHKFSCLMFRLPGELAFKVRQLGERIPSEDLSPTEYGNESGDGRELDPHVTLKFGLHTDDSDEVREALINEAPIAIQLGDCSCFENEDQDVVKIEVESEALHKLNKIVCERLECTDTHPDYKPHVTIAYVKGGSGKKWAERLNDLKGQVAVFDKIVFSNKEREHHEIPLTGPAQFDEGGIPSNGVTFQ